MLAVDIIRPIAHQDVRCCAATTLAKKTHEGDGLELDTLMQDFHQLLNNYHQEKRQTLTPKLPLHRTNGESVKTLQS